MSTRPTKVLRKLKRSSSETFTRLRRTSSNLFEYAYETVTVKEADGCDTCRRLSFCTEHGFFRPTVRDNMPDFMRNRYLTEGYRPAEMTFRLCFKSMFTWNNETINIWSHIFGLIFFTFCQAYDNVYNLPKLGALWTDHLVCSCSLLCFQICMLMSVCFHLFSCNSEWAFHTFLSLDLVGISMGVLGVYLSGLYYGFFCFEIWLNIYMSIFCLVTLATLAGPLHREYKREKFCWGRLGFHHFVYAAIILYGLIPTLHWVYLHDGWGSDTVQRFLPNVIVVYALTGLAFVFYAFAMPERWKPGHFDIFGWSHQWWHLLIFLALVWWRSAGMDLMAFRKANACQ